ncbi:unnamed protein product [Plutella xylostella]|uniref:(diamondback moth) hypothetical protein n=1 Tax=Plutella xylostella TaxID=51655 RepID=A0A8S4FSX2_PLUXY|nr:unnamed protein product [Plutella xylostella]
MKRVGPCYNEPKVAVSLSEFSISRNTYNFTLNGEINISRDIENEWTVKAFLQKCQDIRNLDTCDHYRSFMLVKTGCEADDDDDDDEQAYLQLFKFIEPAILGVVRQVNALPMEKTIVTKPRKEKLRFDPKTNDTRHDIKELRLASWNVRSLFRVGAMYQVNAELKKYGIEIAALQEVRWPGKGECNVDSNTVLFYSGSDHGEHMYGTGFMVSRNMIGSVIRFDAVSDRISVLRLKGKFCNYSIINVYAPTEMSEDSKKDEFYDHLEETYDQLPSFDAKLLIGDFNAQVGREAAFMPTIGKHSKHATTNDNGLRLISFATARALVIKSTMFPHKDIHKGTWKSPDGKTVNQIDHAVIDDRHKSTIQDVRSYRGPDCDSDHYLLGIQLRARITVKRRNNTRKEEPINLDNLRDPDIREKFRLELNNRFNQLTVDADIDNHWDSVKHTVKTTAVKVLGRKRNTKRRKWWNQDCEEIVKERRKCKIQAENNEEWVAKYKKVQTEARTIIKRAKRQHLDNIVRGMETLLRANESRKFYKAVSSCKKGYQPTAQFLEDDDGNLISDRDTIMTCWRDYFQQLLNCQPLEEQVPRSMEHNSEIVEPPTFEEVREAIMRLKNHKAPGIDDLPSELWKYGGGRVQSELFQLLCKIWEEEKQPKEWNLGVICPVHKKGSKKKCTNYRGIALLPTAYKVLSYVLLKRLEPYTEKILGDYQCGFRRNRSTVDQIFLLKQLMEKKWEYAQSIHSLFVDFTKAYDSIDREALFTILRNFKIPAKIVSMVEVATRESRMKVRVGGELTDEFAVVTGLKQGDALSPMLFNLALEHVLRGVLELDFGLQLNGKHKVVGYADDLAVLGKTAEEVRKAAKLLDTEAGKIGLRINRGKSEYLHMKRYKDKSGRRQDLHVGDVTYKGVSRFKYLGCTVTDTNTRDEEIDTRIQSFLRCSAALHKVLTSRLLSRNTKLRIYKTVIRPILMYGCEAWTLTQKEESKLLVAERKVLRKIFGPRQRPDGSWRVLKNAELEDLMAGANIVGETKAHRLRWLGHLQRMGEDRSAKRAYMGRPTGRRPVGRPRYRWSDAVEADLRELQVVDWR